MSDGGVNLGKWILGTRPDCGVFIHAHCEDVRAVSATQGGLRPVSQAYIYLREHITYLGYDFAKDDGYAALFRRAIADHDIVVSHHYGYYALGLSAAEAFVARSTCAKRVRCRSRRRPRRPARAAPRWNRSLARAPGSSSTFPAAPPSPVRRSFCGTAAASWSSGPRCCPAPSPLPPLRLISENPAYEPYTCLADEANIVGKVIWTIRRV